MAKYLIAIAALAAYLYFVSQTKKGQPLDAWIKKSYPRAGLIAAGGLLVTIVGFRLGKRA